VELLGLDRQSPVPLYYQIAQHLLGQIRKEKIKPGKPLPSEEEISRRLSVSRMTARQALKSLCDLGVAFSKRGKGTFVAVHKLNKNLRGVQSFTEEMTALGFRARSKILSMEVVDAPGEAAEALHLAPGEKYLRLQRLRLTDSTPMGVECSCLPRRLCPDMMEKLKDSMSLYRTLSEVYGIDIALADEVVEVAGASAEEARLLRIPKGSPVFLFTRTSYVSSGQAVEYVKSTFRGDRYRITNRFRRDAKESFLGGKI